MKTWHWFLGGIVFLVLVGLFIRATPYSPPEPSKPTSNEQERDNVAPSIQKTYQEIFSVNGKGNSNTETFRASGGKLKFVATTSGGSYGSYSGIHLKSEDGRNLSNANLSISTEGTEAGKGETIIRDATVGSYFFSVISGVEWEIHVFEEK